MAAEPLPIIEAQPSAACTACIVIPARDEADSVGRTLAALAAQHDLTGRPLARDAFEIVLLVNNSRDATASIARRFGDTHPEIALYVIEIDLPPDVAHVGSARRIAMDEACRRLYAVGRPRGVIATTDADTIVAPDWLAATLHEVARGAEAVGGRIFVDPQERRAMASSVHRRFLRNIGYRALVNEVAARIDPRPGDPWPSHEQFSGASIALTAYAYRQVGGLPALRSSEDVALGQALRRADVEIRHSPAVRVRTSARLKGRAPDGMADLLSGWSRMSADDHLPTVPNAATVVAEATSRRCLRDLWQRARTDRETCAAEVAHLADFAGVREVWLKHALRAADRFGVLLGEFEDRSHWRQSPDLVDIRDAIDGLRQWLEPYRRVGAPSPSFARHLAGLPFLPLTCRGVGFRVPPRPALASAPLKEIEPVAPFSAPLAPSPQVA